MPLRHKMATESEKKTTDYCRQKKGKYRKSNKEDGV